ncbi:MAG TPA: carboxypeptidase-like regulatory domain-containing protein, partial [Flavitalea sp.]|nr:carboxypeptidase-like regulatory domain-containing protein [Flavitalea sp.]
MMKQFKGFVLASSIGLLSCGTHKNTTDIIAEGVVLDSITGKPVPNAKVTVLCWRVVGSDEETYDKIDTVADQNGRFTVNFEEGFKLDIGSIASNYHPYVQEIKDLKQISDIKVTLQPNTAKGRMQNLGQLAVFMRKYEAQSRT